MEKLGFIEFENIINEIKYVHDFNKSVYDAAAKYSRNTELDDGIEIRFPSLDYICVDLLEQLMGDEDGWISYYCFDLDFGRRSNCQIVKNDKEKVDLCTIYDLFDLIFANKNNILFTENNAEVPFTD